MASLKRWLDRKRNPWKAQFYDAFKAFRKDGAQSRLEDYSDLPADSIVLDIGGFRGEWTDHVLAHQPDCTVHILEPHPGFAGELRAKFTGDTRVHVHECALGAAAGTLELSDAGDASSAVADHSRSFTAQVVPVAEFFAENGIVTAELMKMNIEGGEYALLPALSEAGVLVRINRLQVQFHLFEPGLAKARDAICEELSKTHRRSWCYPFVWEEWQRKTG